MRKNTRLPKSLFLLAAFAGVLGAAQNVSVNCTSNIMTIAVEMSYMRVQSASGLSLNNPACQPTQLGSKLYLSWNLSHCGDIITQSGSKTTYTNTLKRNSVPGSLITRNHDNKATVSCTFENNASVSGGHFQPSFSQQTITEQGFGQYTVGLDITDSSYSHPITNFPVQVQLQELIYFNLSVRSTAALDIFAVRCYATPQTSATSTPQYEFLKEDCPQDSTLFINSSSPQSMTFGMEAFKFLGDYPYVYVHCEVIVCHTSQPGSRCSLGCLDEAGRRRRQATDGSFFGGSSRHTLRQGPFTRSTGTMLVPQAGSKRSGSVCPAVSYILLAGTALIPSMLLLVAL